MPIDPQQLAYLPFQNGPALLDWLREHGDWHRLLGQEATKRGDVNLVTARVMDMANRDDWAFFHNEEHVKIAEFFRTAAVPDLTYWDANDPVNFNNWLAAHAIVHLQARQAAGIP